MNRYTLAVLAVAFFFPALPAHAEADKEKAKLKGAWVVVSAERNGEKMAEEKVKRLKVIFRSDIVLVSDGNKDDRAKYRMDPTQTPGAIDFMPLKEKKVVRGIYSVDGDTLKICYDPDEDAKGRPTEFTSRGGKGRVLMVLKRDKP